MLRCLQRFLLGGACVLLLAASAGAQWRPFGDDPYQRRPRFPGRNGVVEQVLSDLDRAWSHAYVDHHERKHFEQARKDLLRFQDRWARGDFDKGRLDGAIENIHHLANSDRVQPRDRQMLARDLYSLRAFRSNRGYDRGWRPY